MDLSLLFTESVGIALYSSRRFIEVFSPINNQTYLGTTASRSLEITPGDIVRYKLDTQNNSNNHITILSIEDRKNLLKRSYEKKTKLLAANLQSLWIVTAPEPLFNTIAIDRTLVAAENENINCNLIANKSDLDDFKNLIPKVELYSNICKQINFVSAKKKDGLDKITIKDDFNFLNIIAIAGISGVGKSSLINALFPNITIAAGQVSEKTGQGKQTTSAAKGYIVECINNKSITILIDLPGIQNYGVSHLSAEEIVNAMPDIKSLSLNCKFRNCKHQKEPSCAVLDAIESGILTQSRYESYKDMLAEIERINKY